MRLLLSICLLLVVVLPVLAESSAPAEQRITPEELQPLFNDLLAERSAQLPGVELRYASLDLPKAFTVPQGHIEHQLIPTKPGVIGSRRMTILTRVDGQVVANQSVRVEVEALAEVAVANAKLTRSKVLDAEDISMQQRDITHLREPIFNPEDIYGKRLKRTVRLGQPLSLTQIDFPPMIERGDRVEIHLQRGGLTLTAVGEAREDGRADETIRVLNSSSRREIRARVTAPGLVTVEF